MSEEKSDLVGEVVGQEFSTAALPMPNQTRDQMRVVWNGGRSWRLLHIARGNEPWTLPGREVLFGKDDIRESADNNRAVIVVSGPHSGLTSFYRWLPAADKEFPILTVDLREATLRGEEVPEKMKGISQALQREIRHLIRYSVADEPPAIEELLSIDEPIDLLTELAQVSYEHSIPLGALAFRGFEALDEVVAQRFFGRLRGLLESTRRPLGSIGIILLGQSVRALDPLEELPVSTLHSISDIYTPTGFYVREVDDMCQRLGLAKKSSDALLRWSGCEPLLVNALLQILSRETPRKTADLSSEIKAAIEMIERRPPPAFGTWVRTLVRQLDNPATRRIIERLQRRGQCPDDPSEPRFAFTELFIENWLRFDAKHSTWFWRSDCRKKLAIEALTLKNFG